MTSSTASSNTNIEALHRFVSLAYGGRALLLAGKRISAGPSASDQPDAATLSTIANIPWAAVVTTEPDGSLAQALAQTHSSGRRIRHLFPDEQIAESLSLRPDVLSVLHLGRVPDDSSANGRVAVGRELRRAQRLSGTLIESLPKQLTPGYLLCIAGACQEDLLDWRALLDIVPSVDPDNVYWFISPDDGFSISDIQNNIPVAHVLAGPLPYWLTQISSQPILSKLAQPSRTLGLGDLSVEVRTKTGIQVLQFRADELREFRPHLEILGPSPQIQQFRTASERYEHFLHVLRTPASQIDMNADFESALFVRRRYVDCLKQLTDRIEKMLSPNQRDADSDGKPTFLPVFLSGPPASGRTMGLLWIGSRLRRQRVLVVRINPTGLIPSLGAVERILRLCEQRGSLVTVVLVDRLERKGVFDLNQRLRSAGRHAIVVATSSPPIKLQRRGDDELPDFDDPRGFEFRLTDRLLPEEIDEFLQFLRQQGVPQPELKQDQLSRRFLFAWLHRLVPEARTNIERVLLDEYDALIKKLEGFVPPPQATLGGTLRLQLAKWIQKTGVHNRPSLPAHGQSNPPLENRGWIEIVHELPRLALLFSCLDHPVLLDLLTRRFFPSLSLYYQPLIGILESYGFIYEGDNAGQPTLEAHNPVVARLLLQHLIPDHTEQIRALGQILSVFPWNEHSYDSPSQKMLVELLKSLSPPRGTFYTDYGRDQDLLALASVFNNIRGDHGCKLPSLMLHEGILLRELAGRQRANKLNFLRQSEQVLREARELVQARPRSPARDHELANLLTALATTRGWQAKECASQRTALDPEAQDLATEAMQLATAARAYEEVYHPLDVAFWVHRDLYKHLPGQSPEHERLKLVLQMQRAIDLANELGALAPEQRSRYDERRVQLTLIQKGVKCASAEAETMAERGDFGGACFIARSNSINDKNEIIGCDAAKKALAMLKSYMPAILRDERAGVLMHRLWVGQFLGGKAIDEGPHAIKTVQTDWAFLEQIAESRNASINSDPLPYVQFWLAVAQAHQGNLEKARRTLSDLQTQTLDYGKRRLDPLVLLCNESEILRLPGIVRRIEALAQGQGQGQLDVLVHVPRLGYEVIVQRRFQGTAFMNRRKGDEVEVLLGFSFWNIHGLAPDWQSTQRVRALNSK